MVAAGRGLGRGSRVMGNGDDEEEEEVKERGEGKEGQECDLERQPLLGGSKDRAGERWTMSGFLELFSFGYGTI